MTDRPTERERHGAVPARSAGHPGDVDLLGDVWSRWLFEGRRMPATTWQTPSGLGGWTVRELYAHVARGVTTLAGLLAQPPGHGRPDLPDAAGYFATLMARGTDGARGVAQAAREFAAARSTVELVDDFDRFASTTLIGARAAGTSIVPTIAGSLRLNDYVLTRVLEATVHLLDLCDAIPGVRPPPGPALRRTVDVLTDLLPAADFIRLATGRSPASVFPVLT